MGTNLLHPLEVCVHRLAVPRREELSILAIAEFGITGLVEMCVLPSVGPNVKLLVVFVWMVSAVNPVDPSIAR